MIEFVLIPEKFDWEKPRYIVRIDGRDVGYVVRHLRHTIRTTYKGERYGYDRTHTCWRPEPSDGRFIRVCYPTRGRAAAALIGWQR